MTDTAFAPGTDGSHRAVSPGPERGRSATTLLCGQDYVADAAAAIGRARSRVRLTTLTIARDGATERMIEALIAAARRGVDVAVSADVFTFADVAGSVLGPATPTPRRRSAVELTQELEAAGVRMTWLGSPRGLLWRGRTHTKLTVVDDVAWSFGGVNLDAPGVRNVDYMVRVEDARTADALAGLHDRITQEGFSRAASTSVDVAAGRLLIDGGRPGDSAIYRAAVAWAARAERVLHVSQYCPTGPLGRLLAARGDLWFNAPHRASPANGALIASSMLATGHRSRYRRRRYLHAKALVFTMPDGLRVALTGSHNFVAAGVRLGTREIALETHDPTLIDQIESFHRTEVAQKREPAHASALRSTPHSHERMGPHSLVKAP
ncbi:phosphatidylserine/phosphatidylglycerophosphate/cardiolipin synthase family protein [Demequina sp. NBRC 110053]|uniref:phospholipase D-like domain-containing protein n=1 Tax=Demequina sp. NBRC 110053 TaxID=1570342 RepID=UPI00135662C1|nr:phospholipase D-like domain-containing protein [Demequina sp. NBRC 110053]